MFICFGGLSSSWPSRAYSDSPPTSNAPLPPLPTVMRFLVTRILFPPFILSPKPRRPTNISLSVPLILSLPPTPSLKQPGAHTCLSLCVSLILYLSVSPTSQAPKSVFLCLCLRFSASLPANTTSAPQQCYLILCTADSLSLFTPYQLSALPVFLSLCSSPSSLSI